MIGYPQPGKAKSERILGAFCAGAGGRVDRRRQLFDGPAAFYGTVGIETLFHQARRRAEQGGEAFYYLDNAYFDCARERYFRASRNALQAIAARPDYGRLADLGVRVAPWRRGGAHVLVVEQSEYFLREIGGYPAGAAHWRDMVVRRLRAQSDREIRIRPWQRDKAKASRTLGDDLAGAWALVTHASSAAVEALLAGVPVFMTGDGAANEFSLGLEAIEAPWRPDGREEWAGRLAASQWTLEEMRAGTAWRALTEEIAA